MADGGPVTRGVGIEAARAPNRTLDLAELGRPDVRRLLAELDGMVAREAGSYLHPSKRWEYPWALERARLAPGSHVLDAGSGASIFPVYLARCGHAVTALDRVVERRFGAAHAVTVEYVAGDLAALPFAAESFDAVFCISVIEHVPEERIPQAMAEFRRVLRRDGRLLLTTDYYRDAEAEIWHEGPDRRFRVDWGVFDEARLRRSILDAPGWVVDGALDLDVDWDRVSPRMRRFHGYPYTSVGVALRATAAGGARNPNA
ncbi:MAG TPA: class I SAM-dependent methyltransferase [Longimicrobiales bacterium]